MAGSEERNDPRVKPRGIADFFEAQVRSRERNDPWVKPMAFTLARTFQGTSVIESSRGCRSVMSSW